MNRPFSQDEQSGQDRVFFFDTTLRDGEQSPGCSMNTPEKLRLAHALEALGVDIIEAGFAIASPGDFAAISSICREVRGPRIASLARTRREDIEAAARSVEGADRSRIHVFLASSDIHLEHKLKISRAQALEQAGEAVRLALYLCGRRGVFSRRRDPIGPGFPVQCGGHGRRRRGDHDQCA